MFELEGKRLWYGALRWPGALDALRHRPGHPVKVKLPPFKDDAVAYIAQHPARRLEFAIATFQRSVYLSTNAGDG
jgi:hypothetical protein